MARNGSGTYTNPYPDFVSGTAISSTQVDTNNSQIATALTQSIAVDGQSVVTQDIPLATHKFTAMKDGNALTDSLSLGQAQAEAFVWCGTAGGSADAITLSPAPGITAYAAGQRFVWMASASTNTTATTVAISGLTPIALQDNGVALTAGQHAASKMFMGILNTTSTMQIMQVRVSGTDPLTVSSLTVTGDATIGDDLTLLSDAAVLGFGVNTDVTLTHVHDTGLSLSAGANMTQLEIISTESGSGSASTLKLNKDSASPANNDYIGQVQFYGDNYAAESTQYARIIGQIVDVTDGSEDGRLYIQVIRAGALANAIVIDDDEVELNATLVDVNANLDVSGTYQGGGTMTTGGNIVIPNSGTIGSASDTAAMTIASTGVVTFSDVPVPPLTSNGRGLRTISTAAASGGVSGDIWYQY